MRLSDHLDADDRLSVRADGLWIEERALIELAATFGTPLNVISEDRLRRRAREFVRAFTAAWPHGPVQVLPSLKANFSLALRRVLTEEGLGCDTFGVSELRAALACGVPPELISVNGSSKSESLVREAVQAGAHLTLDSMREAELVVAVAEDVQRTATVRVRLRPDFSAMGLESEFGDGLTVDDVASRYKPGIPHDDLDAVAAALRGSPWVEVSGCHVHVGRHRPDLALWEAMIPCFVRELAAFAQAMGGGWRPRVLDIGGGFAPRRDAAEAAHALGRAAGEARAASGDDGPRRVPDVAAYARTVCSVLEREMRKAGLPLQGVALQLEPGRGVYANAGLHLARVTNVKRESPRAEDAAALDTLASAALDHFGRGAIPPSGGAAPPQTWVETDTSEAFLPDVNLEGARWTVVNVAAPDAPPVMTADVVGISCGFDVVVAEARLPEVAPGDVLAFLDTGAYQDAASSNFNAMPRPATVLVHGPDAEVIKRAETVAEVFARDVVPARLGEVDLRRLAGTESLTARTLNHVGITVADLDRSAAFYRDLAGLTLLDSGAEDDPVYATMLGVSSVSFRWTELDLANDQVLELVQLLPVAAAPTSALPAGTHIAITVPDAGLVYERLVANGVTVLSPPVALREENHWLGARVFYARDPDGNLVEFVQPGGMPG